MPSYRHLLGGAVGDTPHEAGDPVDPDTPEHKLDEWLDAGVIAAVAEPTLRKSTKRKARDDHDDKHTDRSTDHSGQ